MNFWLWLCFIRCDSQWLLSVHLWRFFITGSFLQLFWVFIIFSFILWFFFTLLNTVDNFFSKFSPNFIIFFQIESMFLSISTHSRSFVSFYFHKCLSFSNFVKRRKTRFVFLFFQISLKLPKFMITVRWLRLQILFFSQAFSVHSQFPSPMHKIWFIKNDRIPICLISPFAFRREAVTRRIWISYLLKQSSKVSPVDNRFFSLECWISRKTSSSFRRSVNRY